MTPILLLCGQSRSGKNTVADLIARHVSSTRGRRTDQIALADPMKRLMRQLFAFPADALWGASEERDIVRFVSPMAPPAANDLLYEFFTEEVFPVKPFDIDDALDAFDAWYKPYSTLTEVAPRNPLRTFGTELVRDKLGEDVWVDTALYVAKDLLVMGGGYTPTEGRLYHQHLGPAGLVEVTDGRFPNEVDGFLNVGAAAVLVERPVQRAATTHRSETELASVPRERFSGIINNDAGLLELERRAFDVFDHLFPKE